MIDKIKDLVEKIQLCESELEKIEKEVLAIDIDRLNKIVQIAIKGIKLDKIYSELCTYNNCNEWRDDECTYIEDEQGKFLKGVMLAKISLNYNRGSCGGNKEEKELFLMQDGSFKVFYHTGDWSNWQDACSRYNRKVSSNQEITQFNFDEIIDRIIDVLNDRLKNMGERTKAQSKRLEKLKSLKIA